MKLITSGNMLCNRLIKCIEKHKFFSFATAWAGVNNGLFETVYANRGKIRHSTIGLHFYQTDPDIIKRLRRNKAVHFAMKSKGVFHPKMYFLWTDEDSWDLFVGSANFTKGGMTLNDEATIHISSSNSGNLSYKDAVDKLKAWYDHYNEFIDDEYLVKYEHLYNKFRKIKEKASGKYGSESKNSIIKSSIMLMEWDSFYKKICENEESETIAKRLQILKRARDEFAKEKFSGMSDDNRKIIAGILVNPQGNEDDIDYGWFGSMHGCGTFKNRIITKNKYISEALDQIPLSGPLSKKHYTDYITAFLQAYPEGRDGLATATRLLAMKRPDYFVCLNSKNMKELCSDFGIKGLGKNYSAYWDEIVERIMDSIWWNAPQPPSANAEEYGVWLGRAAMLDTLYYNHNS